jgi:Uma2 family endonuclease
MAIYQAVTNHVRPAQTNRQNDPWATKAAEDGLLVSEARYWEKYYEHPDHSYEWNNGVLALKAMPDQQQISMYGWFLELLRHYLRARPVAKLLFLEIGFRLELADKVTIRKPDLFVVRNDNPVALADTDRTYQGICDLAVEALSDSDEDEIERDTIDKKAEYEVAGVQEYYILDAHGPHMAFYRLGQQGSYEPIAPNPEGVIQSAVLPGFQFRVDDLYRQPSPIAMANDSVYQTFVLPEYQAEKARAERLAARLRELGLDEE